MRNSLVKILVSQTAIGTSVSLSSIGLQISTLQELVLLTIVLETIEVLVGLGLTKLWKRLVVKKSNPRTTKKDR